MTIACGSVLFHIDQYTSSADSAFAGAEVLAGVAALEAAGFAPQLANIVNANAAAIVRVSIFSSWLSS